MTDITKALPHIVECKGFAKYFEPIAAFNDKRTADYYASDCKAANPSFEYRVNSNYDGK